MLLPTHVFHVSYQIPSFPFTFVHSSKFFFLLHSAAGSQKHPAQEITVLCIGIGITI